MNFVSSFSNSHVSSKPNKNSIDWRLIMISFFRFKLISIKAMFTLSYDLDDKKHYQVIIAYKTNTNNNNDNYNINIFTI